MNTHGLKLVRSDTGDGGWSLHAPELEDEDGYSPVLVNGPAEWVEKSFYHDGWNRPTQADYDRAIGAWDAAATLGSLPRRKA